MMEVAAMRREDRVWWCVFLVGFEWCGVFFFFGEREGGKGIEGGSSLDCWFTWLDDAHTPTHTPTIP